MQSQTVPAEPQPTPSQRSTHPLEPLFHPRTIAVVGASSAGSAGYGFVKRLQEFGFKGRIYPVSPNGSALLGLPIYPSISAIPDVVDYVIFAVPASAVPGVMEECVAKGVKLAHLFTARLSETGVPELTALERRIVEIARQGGIRVLGSNGMGLYTPREGISFWPSFPKEPGNVAFISQSGGNAGEYGYRASLRGIRFSKIISYGNACDLNEADYLEYLAEDPETDLITAYIEGVKDGRRFLEALKRAAQAKPVVVMKGGRTSAGARATRSHTASLAGDDQVWNGLLRQAGALRAESRDDLDDLAAALRFFPNPRGRSVCFYGAGGGGSIAAADACEEAGLTLLPLPGDIVEELKQLAPTTWMMLGNPVDVSAIGAPQVSRQLLERLSRHEAYDLIIIDFYMDFLYNEEGTQEGVHRTVSTVIELQRETGRPTAVIIRPGDSPAEWRWRAAREERERCVQAGLPVFSSLDRASHTLGRVIRYYEERVERGSS